MATQRLVRLDAEALRLPRLAVLSNLVFSRPFPPRCTTFQEGRGTCEVDRPITL